MRIGLNLLHALPEIGGGWEYIGGIVAALGRCDRENTYIAFVTQASECLVPLQSSFEKVLIDIHSTRRLWRVAVENTALQVLARRKALDCLHWFANTEGVVNAVPAAVTIYDLQPFSGHTRLSVAKALWTRTMLKRTARHAPMLMPMSMATGEALVRELGASPNRMVVVPPVVDGSFQPTVPTEAKAFRTRYQLPDQFWLYVAHFYPHKNHLRLVEAYGQLRNSRSTAWPLVLRGEPKGTEGQTWQKIRELGLESYVIMLPRLHREEVPLLYSSASALVFPSLYEGGGMPVVEAMACGCPVLASGLPPVREFAGEAAVYIDPCDVLGLSDQMASLEEHAEPRERMKELGLAQARAFRPDRVVERLLRAYAIATGA
jgi:glycosyltransferase involved in cell wall biosynthesis